MEASRAYWALKAVARQRNQLLALAQNLQQELREAQRPVAGPEGAQEADQAAQAAPEAPVGPVE